MPDALNIAHRGARSLAPENTLAAAELALAHGADMWEIDVALSADGVPYLLHDDTLSRTTNAEQHVPLRAPWRSGDFSFAALRELDAGSWFNRSDPFGQIAAGEVRAEWQQRYVGEQLPSLAEALAFTRDNDWRINVEIKDLSATVEDATVVQAVWEEVERAGMGHRVLFSSFRHAYLAHLRALSPSVALGVLVPANVASPLALVRSLDGQAYHPPAYDPPQPGQVATLQAAGIDLFVWTVNEPAHAQALLALGASGLFTDFPQRWAAFTAA